jgi:hypothetical protein
MKVELKPLTRGQSHFVGFHDITPWNTETDEIVCLRTETAEDHVPGTNDRAEVILLSPEGNERVLAETYAWNWQKGSRQQFVPAIGKRVVAYNDRTERGFAGVLLDLDAPEGAMEQARFSRAIYDISPDGKFALSLDMVKLVECQPGYGYAHPNLGEEAPGDEGVWRIDLFSGESRLILSMDEFIRKERLSRDLGRHYFTHIQISPDSRKYVFMHRCFLASGGLINNLVVAEMDGSGHRIVHDDKMSHFDWEGPESIIVWCRQNAAVRALKESRIKAIARPLYQLSKKIRSNAVRQNLYNEAFRRIDLSTGKKSVVGRNVLPEDGHPQVNPKHPNIWVNDTYPNPSHVQTLMLFNSRTNDRREIAHLPTQPSIQETIFRCDLHPRWKPSGDMVCVDSAHLGRRQVCVADVSALVEEMAGFAA